MQKKILTLNVLKGAVLLGANHYFLKGSLLLHASRGMDYTELFKNCFMFRKKGLVATPSTAAAPT